MKPRRMGLAGIFLLGGMVLLTACAAQVQIRDGGAMASVTIAGRTFTVMFGNTVQFGIQAGAPAVKTGVQVKNLFDIVPTPGNEPQTAKVTLLPSAVSVTPLAVGKAMPRMQLISGAYDVVVYIGDVDSTDPCLDGTPVGTFRIRVSGGSVVLETAELDVPALALVHLTTGSFTICMEATGDADATLTIESMDVEFGPAASSAPSGPSGQTTTARFHFRNDDTMNVHFLLPGQDFPENRVSPGQTAVRMMPNATIGESIPVRAGRNGVVLATTDCPTVSGPNYEVLVVYDGMSLTCDDVGADGGEPSDSGPTMSAAALAGCWRTTINEVEDGVSEASTVILEIDASGNLATLWGEMEFTIDDEAQTGLLEFARFTEPNAGLFGSLIQNTDQSVSIDPSGAADISCCFDMVSEDEVAHVEVDIRNAALTGDPPTAFTSSDVSGTSLSGTMVGPASGSKTTCPDTAQQEVISQEEFATDFDFELCGEGTAMMMPLMLFGIAWLKWRR